MANSTNLNAPSISNSIPRPLHGQRSVPVQKSPRKKFLYSNRYLYWPDYYNPMTTIRQWSGRPGLNPRLSHTKDFKNGTWHRLAQQYKVLSRVKWINPGKGVAPSPTPQCGRYWKGSLLVAINWGSQLLLLRRQDVYFLSFLKSLNNLTHLWSTSKCRDILIEIPPYYIINKRKYRKTLNPWAPMYKKSTSNITDTFLNSYNTFFQ